MHKFASLVKNESIKLIKRKGTLIMTVLFLAAIIGLTGLCKIVADNNAQDDFDWLQDAFQVGTVGGNVDYYEALYNNSIVYDESGNILSSDLELKELYEYWSYLAEHEIRHDDWLYTSGLYEEYCGMRFALENGTAGTLADEYVARMAQIERYMTEDGWKTYYQDKIAELQSGYTGVDKEAQLWFYRYGLEREIAPESGEMYTLLLSVRNSKTALEELNVEQAQGGSVSEERRKALEDEVTLGVYRLESEVTRDISAEVETSSLFELSDFSFWSVFAACKMLIKLVGVMCIVIAGSIVASEFSQGTYKFLLMSPAKRWKILVAKFVTVLLFGIVMMAALYLLWQVDGNYFILLYTLLAMTAVIILGKLQSRFLARLIMKMLVPFAVFNVTVTAVSNWAGALGLSPVRLVHAGYYDHRAEEKERLIHYGNQEIWEILAEDPKTRVLIFGEQPELLSFPCNAQSYTDIEGSGGNYMITASTEALVEYLIFADMDYVYLGSGYLRPGTEAWDHVISMLRDGYLTELTYENGNALAVFCPEPPAPEDPDGAVEEFSANYWPGEQR